MQKIVIVPSMNTTPEDKLEERLVPLFAEGYRITSATTALIDHGDMDIRQPGSLWLGVARHIYYVTTVVLEK